MVLSFRVLVILCSFLLLLLFVMSRQKCSENSENYSRSNVGDVKVFAIYIPDRLENIKNTLEGLGLEATYVPGISKEFLHPDKLLQDGIITPEWVEYSTTNKYEVDFRKPVNTGRVGCHLGHLAALTAFLDSSATYALIFEDDIDVPPETMPEMKIQIDQVLSEIPADAQIVYLSYCWEKCAKLIPASNPIFSHAVRPLCRHAYLVRRDGASVILETTYPMRDSGDKMVADLIQQGVLKAYVVNPSFLEIRQKRHPTGIFKSNSGNTKASQACVPP